MSSIVTLSSAPRGPKPLPQCKAPRPERFEWVERRVGLYSLLGISIFALIAYLPSLSGDFVFDSRFLVLQDDRVHSITREHIQQIFQYSYWWPYVDSNLFRPVTTLSFLVNYWLSGTASLSYHLTNMFLHIANACLFFVICRRITANWLRSIIIALVWTVTPLSSEAVANIAGRADLLAAFFVFLAFLSYLRFVETRSWLWLLLIVTCTLLGVFAKESAVAIAPIVACHYWLYRRFSRKEVLQLAVALATPLVLLILVRWRVLGAVVSRTIPFVDNPMIDAPWGVGYIVALRILGSYVALFAWPAHLLPDYSYPELRTSLGGGAELAPLATIAATMLVTWRFRSNRVALFGFAIAFFAILPASNLLFFSGTIMGERLMYLASAGLCLSLVAICADIGLAGRPVLTAAIVCILLCGWTIRTNARSSQWTSELLLWQSAMASGANSAKAHRAFSEALYDGDPQHANLNLVLDHARTAASLLSDLPLKKRSFQEYRQLAAYSIDAANRSSQPDTRRHFTEGLNAADTAIEIVSSQTEPNDPEGRHTKGDLYRLKSVAHSGLGDNQAAQIDAQRAIELNAFHPLAYLLSANAALALKETDSAAEALAMGAMVLESTDLSNELTKLYQHVDPAGCSLQNVSGVVLVNPRCPTVWGPICRAARRAIVALQAANRSVDAVSARMRNEFGCDLATP